MPFLNVRIQRMGLRGAPAGGGADPRESRCARQAAAPSSQRRGDSDGRPATRGALLAQAPIRTCTHSEAPADG